MLSKEVLLQLEEAENAKDLQAMAKKLGYDLTDAEAEKVFAMFEQDLSDEELDKVAGGEITSIENPDMINGAHRALRSHRTSK